MILRSGATAGLETLHGPVISLLYQSAEQQPRPMRREVAAAGWEAAAPSAHPQLVVLNTPGGGLPMAAFTDLVALLGAIARYAGSLAPLPRGSAEDWLDPETGTRIAALRE